MQEVTIPCPDCNTSIPMDVKGLISGVQFTCPNCGANIGLAKDSKPLVQDTLSKFDQIKKDVGEK